jgi:hypothetical protein
MTELRARSEGPFRLEIDLLARGSATCGR